MDTYTQVLREAFTTKLREVGGGLSHASTKIGTLDEKGMGNARRVVEAAQHVHLAHLKWEQGEKREAMKHLDWAEDKLYVDSVEVDQ